jgi:hypothetical protein
VTARTQRQRTRAALTILAVFAVIVGVAAFAQINNTATTATTDTTSTTAVKTITTPPAPSTTVDPATLDGAAKELYTLVQTGRASRYHVVFTLSGPSLTQDTTEAVLEVWRDGARIRQDTKLTDARGTTHGTNIGGPNGTIVCQEQVGVPLACQQQTTGPLDPNSDLLTTITDRLGATTVEARDDTVLGGPARCFTLDKANAANTADLCLTPQGAPVTIDTAGLKAVATKLDTTVDDSSFVPPAPVSGPETTVLNSTVITAPANSS